jgi:hypothetical protein
MNNYCRGVEVGTGAECDSARLDAKKEDCAGIVDESAPLSERQLELAPGKRLS